MHNNGHKDVKAGRSQPRSKALLSLPPLLLRRKNLVQDGHVELLDKRFPFVIYFDPTIGRTGIRLKKHFKNKSLPYKSQKS